MKTSTFLATLAACLGAVAAADDKRHFYTTDPNGEGQTGNGYTLQGIAAYVWSSPIGGTVPIYRCHSGDLWLYTSDFGCEGASGYSIDGLAFYLLHDQLDGSSEFTRWTQNNGDKWCVDSEKASGHPEQFGMYTEDGTLGFYFDEQRPRNQPLYAFAKGNLS